MTDWAPTLLCSPFIYERYLPGPGPSIQSQQLTAVGRPSIQSLWSINGRFAGKRRILRLRPCACLTGVDVDDDAGGAEEAEEGRREMCWVGCGRPVSVCVCAHLPPQPLPTSTTVVVLHHPHAIRRNPLATLPLLARSLLHCHPISGRRLCLGSHPVLDSLYRRERERERECEGRRPTDRPSAVFLFPGGRDLSLLAAGPPPVLVVFDGTWRQAKEMVTASLPFLEQFAVRVSLGGCNPGVEGPSTFESELVLRKEPFQGCVSTMEAVARALRMMEPDGKGAEVEAVLLSLLRAMVGFQAQHLKPMKPRPKLRKKERMTAAGTAHRTPESDKISSDHGTTTRHCPGSNQPL